MLSYLLPQAVTFASFPTRNKNTQKVENWWYPPKITQCRLCLGVDAGLSGQAAGNDLLDLGCGGMGDDAQALAL